MVCYSVVLLKIILHIDHSSKRDTLSVAWEESFILPFVFLLVASVNKLSYRNLFYQ